MLVRPAPTCSTAEWRALLSTWQTFARPAQLRPPGTYRWWNRQCGRGEGKTRSGSEYTLDLMELWGLLFLGGIACRTVNDTHQTLIYGDAGLMACAEARGYKLDHRKSETKIVHPSGASIRTYGGDKQAAFRGFTGNYFWADELAYWKDPMGSFVVLDKALRKKMPNNIRSQGLITCTPDRRGSISRMLAGRSDVFTTIGSSYDNRRNMAEDTLDASERGTPVGTKAHAEEVLGILGDNDAAFSMDNITPHRDISAINRDLKEIVIAIDPNVSVKEEADECGIIVVGAGGHADITHFYVMEDMTCHTVGPQIWATRVLERIAYYRSVFPCRTRIVIEVNQGGYTWDQVFELAAQNSGQPLPNVTNVQATRSKIERADAAGMLYEQGRVHHIGVLSKLEEQMTKWIPGMDSPDRMDALVHGLLDLAAAWPSTGGDLTGRITGA